MIPTTLTHNVETAAIFKVVVQIAFTRIGMSVDSRLKLECGIMGVWFHLVNYLLKEDKFWITWPPNQYHMQEHFSSIAVLGSVQCVLKQSHPQQSYQDNGSLIKTSNFPALVATSIIESVLWSQ